jgi:hypothetical protein
MRKFSKINESSEEDEIKDILSEFKDELNLDVHVIRRSINQEEYKIAIQGIRSRRLLGEKGYFCIDKYDNGDTYQSLGSDGVRINSFNVSKELLKRVEDSMKFTTKFYSLYEQVISRLESLGYKVLEAYFAEDFNTIIIGR